jgi:hypothetical protein
MQGREPLGGDGLQPGAEIGCGGDAVKAVLRTSGEDLDMVEVMIRRESSTPPVTRWHKVRLPFASTGSTPYSRGSTSTERPSKSQIQR